MPLTASGMNEKLLHQIEVVHDLNLSPDGLIDEMRRPHEAPEIRDFTTGKV